MLVASALSDIVRLVQPFRKSPVSAHAYRSAFLMWFATACITVSALLRHHDTRHISSICLLVWAFSTSKERFQSPLEDASGSHLPIVFYNVRHARGRCSPKDNKQKVFYFSKENDQSLGQFWRNLPVEHENRDRGEREHWKHQKTRKLQ